MKREPKRSVVNKKGDRLLPKMKRDAAVKTFDRVDIDQLCRKLGTSKIARRALDVAKPYSPLLATMTPERWLQEFAAKVDWLELQRIKPPLHLVEKRKRLKLAAKVWQPPLPLLEKRERLEQVASALAKAEKILSKLPRGYNNLRDEVKRAAETASRYANRVKVPRSGGPRDPEAHIKEYAAQFAFDLLNDYGHPPALTNDGKYFELASILFEAATGSVEVSIMRQCRKYRKEIGPSDTLRVRRKRTGPF